jgi:two-component system sensor histidine kinase MtrB
MVPEVPLADVLDAVSHDLRNPLGTITLGATLLLDRHDFEPRTRRSLEMIERAAHRIQELGERLTDLASIVSRHLQLDLQDVAAADLIAFALTDRVVAVVPAVDGITVRCDKKRVSEVVAMAVGDRLRVTGAPVRIRATRRPNGVALFVIANATAWRSFEHALAHGIVAAHGGELWLEGTNVVFTLPLA